MEILEKPGRDCLRVNSRLIRNDDLVDLRQADTGEKQEFAISEPVESASDLLGDAISAKGMELTIDTDPKLPRSAIGDPLLLRQISAKIMEDSLNSPDSGEMLVSIGLQQELEDEITVGFAFENFGWASAGEAPAKGRQTNIRRVFRFGARLQKGADSRPVRYERISNGQKALILSRSEALREVLCRDLGIFGLDTRQSSSVDDAVERLRSGQDIKVVLIDSAISDDMLDVFEQLRIETQFAVFIAVAPARWNMTPEMKLYVTDVLSKPVNRTAILQMLHKLLGVRGHGRGHGPGRILIDVADEKPGGDYGDKFKGLKVLFVEDNSINQALGRIILEKAGMIVEVAENGLKAVEQIRRRGDEFAIVLLDLHMPVMDGYKVLDAMQRDRAMSNIPVIVISASDSIKNIIKSINLGAADHLPKPFDPVLLKARLNATLKAKLLSDRQKNYRQQLERRVKEQVWQIENSLKKVQQTLEKTVLALSSIVEIRDMYTAGHQQRVAQLSSAVAEKMGLPKMRIEGVRIAAILHDIGKIAVPGEILSKPGKLHDAEFELIKLHTEVAHKVLSTIDFPWPVADIVLQHHERNDGSGYPMGSKGKDLLLESRIIQVSDIVEAMTSHRPYRPALGRAAADKEIKAKRGIFYDPDVVDAYMSMGDFCFR